MYKKQAKKSNGYICYFKIDKITKQQFCPEYICCYIKKSNNKTMLIGA